MKRTEGLSPHDLQQVCYDYTNVIEKRQKRKTKSEKVGTQASMLVSLNSTGYLCQLCNHQVTHMKKLRKHMTNLHIMTDDKFEQLKMCLLEMKTRENNNIPTDVTQIDKTDQCRNVCVNVKNIKVGFVLDHDKIGFINKTSTR